jgi:hypothetical protein
MVTRTFLVLSLWLVMVAVTVWAIGPERKRKWFRQRDLAKSFLNRRGFLGEYIHLGRPCTREGWMIWGGFVAVMLLTGALALVV